MTERQFLQGLFAGAFGTLTGGAAILYTLARLELLGLFLADEKINDLSACQQFFDQAAADETRRPGYEVTHAPISGFACPTPPRSCLP